MWHICDTEYDCIDISEATARGVEVNVVFNISLFGRTESPSDVIYTPPQNLEVQPLVFWFRGDVGTIVCPLNVVGKLPGNWFFQNCFVALVRANVVCDFLEPLARGHDTEMLTCLMPLAQDFLLEVDSFDLKSGSKKIDLQHCPWNLKCDLIVALNLSWQRSVKLEPRQQHLCS